MTAGSRDMAVRVLLRFCLAAVAALTAGPAAAQFMMDHSAQGSLRSFHGTGAPSRIKRSFQSDTEARAELDRILSAVGLNWISDRIALRSSAETENAEAGIGKDNERFIFYNVTFMQKLKAKTKEQWTLVSILAHELGHHLAFHTEITGNDHKFELEADYFSGFVLRRLGATLDQAHAAMKEISPKEATKTHPGLDQRLQVIGIGWTDGGQQGAPHGLKERAPEALAGIGTGAAAPSTAAAEVVRICREVEQVTSLTTLGVLERQHKGAPAADCISARISELKAATLANATAKTVIPELPRQMSDLSGTWRGFAYSGASRFSYEWVVQQTGSRVEGTIALSSVDGRQASYRFQGEIVGTRLTFSGTAWLSNDRGSFCIASGNLEVVQSESVRELRGSWGPHPIPGGCPDGTGGRVTLTKVVR